MTDTIVIRQVRRQGFTTLSNAPLRDPLLSWKAKGLLANLFSHAEGFPLRMSVLVRQSADGRHATNSASMELQRAGYLSITRERDEKGRFVKTTWEIREEPLEPQARKSARAPTPGRSRSPQPDFQAVDISHKPDSQVMEGWTSKEEEQEKAEEPTRAGVFAVPATLSSQDVASALELVGRLKFEVAQQVLDELAAKLEASEVKGAPLAYLKALVTRATSGNFTPSVGIAIAARRQRASATADTARERRREACELAERVAAQRQDPAISKRMEGAMAECRRMLRVSPGSPAGTEIADRRG